MEQITIKPNRQKRHFTIRKKAGKSVSVFRTLQFNKSDFAAAENWTTEDWKVFLAKSDFYIFLTGHAATKQISMQKLFVKVLIKYVIASYLFFAFTQLDLLPFLEWSVMGRAFYAIMLLAISFVTAATVYDRKK